MEMFVENYKSDYEHIKYCLMIDKELKRIFTDSKEPLKMLKMLKTIPYILLLTFPV